MIEIRRCPLAATVSVAMRTSSKLVSTCRVSLAGRLSASTVVRIGPSSSPKLDRRAEVVAPLSLVPVTRSPALFELYELCSTMVETGLEIDRQPGHSCQPELCEPAIELAAKPTIIRLCYSVSSAKRRARLAARPRYCGGASAARRLRSHSGSGSVATNARR